MMGCKRSCVDQRGSCSTRKKKKEAEAKKEFAEAWEEMFSLSAGGRRLKRWRSVVNLVKVSWRYVADALPWNHSAGAACGLVR